MADKTPIEWTDATWNPVAGCAIVSPGCTNCYAMKQAARIERMAAGKPTHYAGLTKSVNGNPVWTGEFHAAPESILTQPLRWQRPRRIFVNSMSDLFGEGVPDDVIDRVFAVIALTPQHTYQVLTKRPKRMKDYLRGAPWGRVEAECAELVDADVYEAWDRAMAATNIARLPLPNLWLGVSVEDQRRADERIPLLLETPAAVRFVSMEPLLGAVDLTRICLVPQRPGSARAGIHIDTLKGRYWESGVPYVGEWDVYSLRSAPAGAPVLRLDWVIVGGESGSDARPMHPDWARSLRDQCAAAGVPFFFKQWGEWAHETQTGMPADRFFTRDGDMKEGLWHLWPDTGTSVKLGKARAGRLLDDIEHNAFPGGAA